MALLVPVSGRRLSVDKVNELVRLAPLATETELVLTVQVDHDG